MIEANLHDVEFAHVKEGSSVHGKAPKRIQWVRARMEYSGVTVFTDRMLTETSLPILVKSRLKVGWLLEPREYVPSRYERIPAIISNLDLLLTHDQALLDAYPAKARLTPFGGSWVNESAFGLHPKTPGRVVQILSGKQFMTGHRLRYEIMARFPEVEHHGWGTPRGRFPNKEPILCQAPFSIVVENSRAPNFFTEKLLDCFAVGTVPIYWGAPNIGKWFDERGLIQFERIEELPTILSNLDYERHLEGVKANLELFRPFEITDDWIALNILEKL